MAVIGDMTMRVSANFMRSRERLEHKIGEPAAAVWAMLDTLRHDEPVRISYDAR